MSASRSNLKTSFMVGGAATCAGLLYLLYNNYQKACTGQCDLPREVALKVLRELRKELYPVFKKILRASKGMRMAAKQQRRTARPMQADPMSSIEKIELCDIPEFREMIQDVESRVYAKYNLENKEIFEKFCLNLQRTDAEVNKLMTEINDTYLQAKQGEAIKLDFVVPEQISEIAAINAQKELHRETLRALKANMEGMGEGHMESEQNMRLMQKRIDEAHETIYRHNGFDVMEEYHPESVFEQACFKFSSSNPEFKKKMQLIDHHFNNVVNQLMTGRISINAVEREFDRINQFLNPPKQELVIDLAPQSRPIEVVEPITTVITESIALNPANIELAESNVDNMAATHETLTPTATATSGMIQLSDTPPSTPFQSVMPQEVFPKMSAERAGDTHEFYTDSVKVDTVLWSQQKSSDAPFEDIFTSHADEENKK